jgi:biopolymer transport protein ExbD
MRRGNVPGDSRINLPIVPMLDMAFQLLFFAIMNFHPSDLEGQLDLSLPSEAQKAAHDQKDVKQNTPADKVPEPEFQADLTVQVISQHDGVNDGEISDISVRALEGKPEPVGDLAGLKRYLKEKREGVNTKEAIKLQGDGRLKIRNILKVMDACREAGFKDISFVPPEATGG